VTFALTAIQRFALDAATRPEPMQGAIFITARNADAADETAAAVDTC
jgi:hypothetical protein